MTEKKDDNKALTMGQFSAQALDVVKNASLLSEDNLKALTQMQEELQHTWEHKQMWRTECEIRNSVLVDSKFPTPDAKYHQAVREQSVFFTELVRLSYDYRKLQQDVKIIEAKKMELEHALQEAIEKDAPKWEILQLEARIEKQKIKLDEKVFAAKNMQLAAQDRMREIRIWSKVKAELEPHLKCSKDDPNETSSS